MYLLLFRIRNYSKHSLSVGIMFLEIPWTMKMWSAKLHLYGKKNGASRTTDTWNIIHKFTINKHKKLCVGVYQTDWTLSGWLNNPTVHDGGREREKQKTWHRKGWSFSALLSVCSYTPLFMVPLQPPSQAAVWGTYLLDCLPQINDYIIHHLEAFLLSNSSQLRPVHNRVRRFTSSHSLCAVRCSRSFSVTSAEWDSRTSWISAPPNPRNLELHGPIQQCSLFCAAGWRIPKSHQLLQAKASSSSHSQFWTLACPWACLHLKYSELCCRISSIHSH